MVVEVVGASPIGQASAAAGSSSATSAAAASVEPARAVIATSGRAKRRVWLDEVGEFRGFPRVGQRQDRVAGDDHAQVAVRGLRRMHEQRGRAGRGQSGGDLARDVAGLAHAGDHDPAGAASSRSTARAKPSSTAAASMRRPAASIARTARATSRSALLGTKVLDPTALGMTATAAVI